MLSVGVCTFRRETLAATIASLGAQALRPDVVVVADNDDVPSARGRAEAAAARAGLALAYVHAPARNISVARNAVLDAAGRLGADRLAWIDDDEVAPMAWLTKMDAALTDGLAAVFGPTRAVYPPDAPRWMRRLRPHDQTVPLTRGQVRCGHTGNALTRPGAQGLSGLRFDPALGRTGSEDTAYFLAGHAGGARYALTDAPVFEPVPDARLSEGWLAERKARAGGVYYRALPSGRARTGLLALPKAAYCVGAALAAGDEASARAARLRGAFHRGVVRAALGVRPSDHYGGTGAGLGHEAASQAARDGSR